jgi:AcrR family transcriptional regulator
MAVGSKAERRTQAQRRADSEHRLLTATAALIVERGLNNVSLTEIGRRAGCSHALVNHLFGSKAALIERLNTVVDDFFVEHTRHAVEQGGAAGLLSFVEVYLGAVTGPDPIGRVHLLLWAEAVAGTPEIRPARAARDERFRAGVATMVSRAAREFDHPIDVESTAFVIVGVLRGVAMQMLLDPASMPLDQAVGQVEHVVTKLLAPQ